MWDSDKLDQLLIEMEDRVREGLEDDEDCAGAIGFWMMQLKACKN